MAESVVVPETPDPATSVTFAASKPRTRKNEAVGQRRRSSRHSTQCSSLATESMLWQRTAKKSTGSGSRQREVFVVKESPDVASYQDQSVIAERLRIAFDSNSCNITIAKDQSPCPEKCHSNDSDDDDIKVKEEGLRGYFDVQVPNLTDHNVVEMDVDSANILNGVVAFVEVRSLHENRSAGVQARLEALGAKSARTMTSRVTHVVFKDGTLSTYNRAKKLGVHIVSVSWVEACRCQGLKVPEEDFPCASKERYESPGLFPKLRKVKSMQPKSDEEFNRFLDRKMKRIAAVKKRREEKERERREKMAPPPPLKLNFFTKAKYPLPLDFYDSPKATEQGGKSSCVLDILQEYERELLTSPVTRCSSTPKCGSSNQDRLLSSPCSSDDLNTPLAKRLAWKLVLREGGNYSPTSATSPSSWREVSVLPKVRQLMDQDYDDDKINSASDTLTRLSPRGTHDETHLHQLIRDEKEVVSVDQSFAVKPDDKIFEENSKKETKVKVENRAAVVKIVPETTQDSRRTIRKLFPSAEENSATGCFAAVGSVKADETFQSTRKACHHRSSQLLQDGGRQRRHVLFSKKKEGFLEVSPVVATGKSTNRFKAIKKEMLPADAASASVKALTLFRPPRRSSAEFELPPLLPPSKVKRTRLEMVFTCCPQEDVNLAMQLTLKFRGFKIRNRVTATTTHVISGLHNKRTASILRGILRGCWILSNSWIYASMEKDSWADEEDHELTDFSPAVRTTRLDRQAFGSSSFKSDLFLKVGKVYVMDDVNLVPSRSELQEFIRLGRGTVVHRSRTADIAIAKEKFDIKSNATIKIISEKWILDSIQHYTVMPLSDYQLRSDGNRS